jgi:hypothetical protein
MLDEKELQGEVFTGALVSLNEAIIQAPSGGTPRLYRLLLLAIADRWEEFVKEARIPSGSRHISLPLETIDMVYLRLKILNERELLPRFADYWSELCGWMHRIRTIGRPVREGTLNVMQ